MVKKPFKNKNKSELKKFHIKILSHSVEETQVKNYGGRRRNITSLRHKEFLKCQNLTILIRDKHLHPSLESMSSLRYLTINPTLSFCINSVPNVISRSYAFKSDLKIKWVRPEKIPCYKPQKSGDLQGVPNLDKKQIILDFQKSKELQTADENVKRLFSLEFAPKKYTNELFIHSMVEKVRRHEHDYSTIETKLARWTGTIRALQEAIEIYPRNKKLKVALKELIDKRKKHLKYLRRWDYKKFEWILESLDLFYKPPPNHFHWITRKESLRKLTDKYCDGIRDQRLNEYRLKLENEQPAFLEEKIRTLQFIRDEQKKCGTEVTVGEEEINDVKKQLEELRQKIKENNTDD